MKKTSTVIQRLLAITLLVIVFTSCNDKNKDEGTEKETKQATSCDFKVNFWFNDSMFDIFDIMINFTEHNGNVVSEVVTKDKTIVGVSSSNEHVLEIDAPASSSLNYFSKEFKDNTFPTSMTYQVIYTLKDNLEESCFYKEEDVLKCDLAYYNEHQCENNFGKRLANSMYSRMAIGMEKDNIEKWLEIQSKIYYQIQIDSDGCLVTDKE